MLKRKRNLFLYIIVLFAAGKAGAQTYLSPYSKFGLGELQSDATIRQRGMGETSIAFMDSNVYSISNPASYSNLYSYCFETALSTRIYQVQDPTGTFKNKDYLIPYFAFAIPLDTHLRWGFSLGLRQYSKVGYIFQQAYTSPLHYNEIYQGSGGYSKFYIGSSIQTFKSLFIGANVGYFFGRQQVNQRVDFTDSITPVSLHRDQYVNGGGLVFDFGAIYRIKFKNRNELQLGFTYSLPANLVARRDIFVNTYVSVNGTDFVSDSVLKQLQSPGRINLPASVGYGIRWKTAKWMIAADYRYQSWAQFRFFERNDSLNNLSALSLGVQFYPGGGRDQFAGSLGYFERMSYRAGMRFAQTYYSLNGNQPTDMRFSIGAGFPIGYRGSAIDLALEYGQIGSLKSNDIVQRYFSISIGLHLFDPGWFYRRKIE